MYLDYEKYKQFGGKLEQSDFDVIESLAELVIDTYTFYRLANMDKLPDNLVDCVAKATYYQVCFIEQNGGADDIIASSESGSIRSESIGNYSVTYNEIAGRFESAGIKISPLACAELDRKALRCNWVGGRCY